MHQDRTTWVICLTLLTPVPIRILKTGFALLRVNSLRVPCMAGVQADGFVHLSYQFTDVSGTVAVTPDPNVFTAVQNAVAEWNNKPDDNK